MKRRDFIGAGMVASTGLLTSCFGVSDQKFLKNADGTGDSDTNRDGGSSGDDKSTGEDGESGKQSNGDDSKSGSDGDSGSDRSEDDGVDNGDTGSDGDEFDGGSGDATHTVETSASEINLGEEYTVKIIVQAGGEKYDNQMVITYQTKDDPDRSEVLQDTNEQWQIPVGESETKSFTIEPEETGELKFGLLSDNHQKVIKKWNVTVNP